MHIVCEEEAREDAVKNGVNLTEFLQLLSLEPSSWDLCEVATSWGLVLFAFFSPLEKAMVPVNFDVLLLTQGTVISDGGQIVPRWQRLAEQIVKWADGHRQPRSVLVVD